jgi:hypothetical protein
VELIAWQALETEADPSMPSDSVANQVRSSTRYS